MTNWCKLTTTGSLTLYDLQLHVLDLYSYEQEVDLADNDILKMISETDKIILRSRIIGLFSTVTAGTMCKQDGKNDCIGNESLSGVQVLLLLS